MTEWLDAILAAELLGHTGRQWLMAAAVTGGALLLFFAATPFARKRITTMAERTRTA
jgi:hypothetical protein